MIILQLFTNYYMSIELNEQDYKEIYELSKLKEENANDYIRFLVLNNDIKSLFKNYDYDKNSIINLNNNRVSIEKRDWQYNYFENKSISEFYYDYIKNLNLLEKRNNTTSINNIKFEISLLYKIMIEYLHKVENTPNIDYPEKGTFFTQRRSISNLINIENNK